MDIGKIFKEVLSVQEQSIEREKKARVQIVLSKRAVYEAFMGGFPLFGDEIVKHFDTFSGYSMLQIVYVFDGQGGIDEKMYAIKDKNGN